jgi:phosphoglycerate dehydrogenase-like enzyme
MDYHSYRNACAVLVGAAAIVKRKTRRMANCRATVSRIALIAAGVLLLSIPNRSGFAAEGKNGQASGAATASPLSMTDQEVAATIARLGLKQSDKPVREILKSWHKPTKAIVFAEGSPQWIPWLESVAPDMKFVVVDGYSVHGVNRDGGRGGRSLTKEQLAEIADADVQIGGSCSKAILDAAKNLQMIISAHVGIEGCSGANAPQKLLDGEVILTNQQKTYGLPIATHAIAMMLALDRGLDLYVRQADAEHWVASPPGRLQYPQGETMLVVGLGGLGTDMARLGHDLGMKIIATRATSHEGPDFVDYVGLSNELPDLVGKADVVMSALPLTDETKHTFNADIFGRMKKGALFINVSRGGVVDSNALVAALKSGQVGGAGLDVTEPEPLPPGDPLWHAPNIIITPHMSAHWSNEESVENMGNNTIEAWAIMRENFRRYIAGDKLYSLVDPKSGY